MKSSSWIIILIVLNIIIIFMMRPSGNALKHPATPSGIIALEFAYDSARTQNIINAWDTDLSAETNLISQARKNIKLDFIFLLFYSALLYASVNKWGSGGSKARNIMKGLSIIAGLADAIENLLMMRSLDDKISNANSFVTTGFATIKFSFILVVLLYILWSIAAKKFKIRTGHN